MRLTHANDFRRRELEYKPHNRGLGPHVHALLLLWLGGGRSLLFATEVIFVAKWVHSLILRRLFSVRV